MNIFKQLLAILIIMIIGYVARHLGLLDKGSTKKLNGLLMKVCYPLLIIVSFNQNYTAQKLGLLGTVLIISLLLHLVPTVVAAFVFRSGRKTEDSVLKFSLIFQNCGFIGLPLLKIIFGDLGAFYGASFILFSELYISTVGVFILTSSTQRNLKKHLIALLNPSLVSAVIGVVLFVCRIRLSNVLLDSVGVVGEMAIPLSFLLIGSMIREITIKELFASLDAYIVVFIKMLALPSLTLIICLIFGVSKWTSLTCILMAALPSTTALPYYADQYGGSRAKAIAVSALSAIVSTFTIPIIIYVTNIAIK